MEGYCCLQKYMAMNHPSRLAHVDIKVILEPTLVCCPPFNFEHVVVTIKLNLPIPYAFGLRPNSLLLILLLLQFRFFIAKPTRVKYTSLDIYLKRLISPSENNFL